jgi:Cu2+-exporting ATPase
LLQGAGLEQYYEFREQLGEQGRRVEGQGAPELGEFDTPDFQELYCDKLASGRVQTELLVEGVHCAACVWLVEKLPRLEPGAVEARLDMARSSVTLTWDPDKTPLSQVARTLTSMGYRPRPYRGKEAARLRRDELRSLLIRIGVSGASAGNVMLMAFALYSGDVGITESGTMSAQTTRFFEVLSLAVSLPALWAGSLFFRGAWSALRARTPHMDLPIAIGILVGFAWGAYGALLGTGEIYFDSITALIFFLLIGRYLQRRHQLAAADAAELLHAVVPGVATIVEGEGTRRTPTAELAVGARVVVESGAVVPVDGTVIEGRSALDKSLLSGESRPISVEQGELAEAGALNLGSQIIVEATRAGGETRVAQLMRQVEKALSTRTRLVGQADRIAGVFTVAVLGLAVVVAIVHSFDSTTSAIEHALALLIVACPCALGLATPLALSAAVSQAARARKLIFSASALEQLARPTELVLDKTGTLTRGKLSVNRWDGDESLIPLIAEMEERSGHPVAVALRGYAGPIQSTGASPLPTSLQLTSEVTEQLGSGLRVETSEGQLRVGSVRFATEGAMVPAALSDRLAQGLGDDAPVVVSLAGEVRAIAWLGDAVRPDAAASLLELKKRGHRLHLLSGDHEPTVRRMAASICEKAGNSALFSSVQGGVTPEEKLFYIADLKKAERPVAMVGDGVNDAGALAAADIGISVKGAAEASRLSSDVYLSASGVAELAALVSGAVRTLGTIRRGIAFSLAYNAVGITCAALGIIGPLWAAVLMPLSSLTVVTNAYKSRMFSGGHAADPSPTHSRKIAEANS